MREFDHNGLLLAEFQGKLFEKSEELNCSSPIFIRRFLHSDLLKKLDDGNSAMISLDVNEGIQNILQQFGDSSYGKEKYSKSALFGWVICIDILLIPENRQPAILWNCLT